MRQRVTCDGIGAGPLGPDSHGVAYQSLAPLFLRQSAEGDPLVHQRGDRDPPPGADVAEPALIGDAYVGEVHLVELGVAGHLPQRAYLDARCLHVDDEVGQAVVLACLWVAAGEQQSPSGDVRLGGPHLLAVDRPLVAVALGACRKRGEVGPCPWFAEQLAPDLVAHERGAQEPLLMLLATERDDRRRRHADAHEIDRRVGRGTGALQAVVDDLLQLRVEPEAAESRREVHPRQPEVVLRGPEVTRRGLLRVVLGEEAVDELVDSRGVGHRYRVSSVHAPTPGAPYTCV